MSPGRLLLGAAGASVTAYGAWLLWSRREPADVLDAAVWAGGAVLVHDVLLAAVLLLAGLVLARLVPAVARAPVVVGAVVLGSLSLVAVPVLGSWGRDTDPTNETLLDRDYVAGWWVLAALVAAGVLVGVAVRLLRARHARP
ncbi:hypothetical protein I601_2921 [Nocardioides dokdonensis FR1436]|uniref:Uncharacterized protein n=1 Tax=Nocardioides dokdonensis FR1436 TaxID=1300347 RepID=A0A1A9GLX9_9ACTN|nr:hypothetical protein [Nocardioides dokdonensis]ANH39337.1 hypothetical protein I601_2921 [Nocardioides dokdonensis FR1436]